MAGADAAVIQRVGDGGGGWLAGLLYDRFAYGAAFLVGVMFNLANL